jgi:hypothetical protein
MIKFNDTPIESYIVSNKIIYVKREDLCTNYPMPPLAKMRGVYEFLKKQHNLIGNMDTRVSKSGQGVAVICKDLGLPYEYFVQQLKGEDIYLRDTVKVAIECGAKIYPMQATRNSIFFSRAKKIVDNKNGILLPVGLPFYETVLEIVRVIKTVSKEYLTGTIIMATGTGTIMSGVLCGLIERLIMPQLVIGISAGWSIEKQKKLINNNTERYSDSKQDMFYYRNFRSEIIHKLKLYHSKRAYYEHTPVDIPFPAHNTYEGKTWEWLLENINNLPEPILFWNIGS